MEKILEQGNVVLSDKICRKCNESDKCIVGIMIRHFPTCREVVFDEEGCPKDWRVDV